MAGTIQGNQYDLNGGDLILDPDGDTFIRSSSDDQIEVHIGGAKKLDYQAGAFAFQEATIVSTTAGNLTLTPSGAVDITKQLTLTGLDSTDRLEIEQADTTPIIRVDTTNKWMYLYNGTVLRLFSDTGVTLKGQWLASTGQLQVDSIIECSAGAGVTIEGCKLEDSEISAAGALTLTSGSTIVFGVKPNLSGIGAGNSLMQIIGTSDTPAASWASEAGYEVNTAPAGWMEVDIGGTPYYIPYWT